MITSHLRLGDIVFTGDYFTALVGEATQNCYGIVGMASRGVSDTIKGLVFKEPSVDKGVLVTEDDEKLSIELHIVVSYGVNIASVSKSIIHRVREQVERATGLKVARVTVCVDDV